MASKDYRHEHDLGIDEAMSRLKPAMARMSDKYGLEMDVQGNDRIKLHRSGIDTFIVVKENEVTATVELSWLMEKTLRGTIEEGLTNKIPKLLA